MTCVRNPNPRSFRSSRLQEAYRAGNWRAPLVLAKELRRDAYRNATIWSDYRRVSRARVMPPAFRFPWG